MQEELKLKRKEEIEKLERDGKWEEKYTIDDPSDQELIDVVHVKSIRIATMKDSFIEVFINVVLNLKKPELINYAFDCLTSLLKFVLNATYISEEHLTLVIAAPNYEKKQWVVFKTYDDHVENEKEEKSIGRQVSKKLAILKYRVNMYGLSRIDGKQKLKNLAGKAAKIASNVIPILDSIKSFVPFMPKTNYENLGKKIGEFGKLEETDELRSSRKMASKVNNIDEKFSVIFNLIAAHASPISVDAKETKYIISSLFEMCNEEPLESGEKAIEINDLYKCLELFKMAKADQTFHTNVVEKVRNISEPYVKYQDFYVFLSHELAKL